MDFYLEKAKELLGQFDTVTITQIPRNENSNADALSCLTTGLEDSLLKTVPLEILDCDDLKITRTFNTKIMFFSW